MNTNVRDPKVNDGDWKAMVYSLNSNIRDPRVNDSKSGAIAFVTIPSSLIRKLRKQKPLAKSAVNMFGVKNVGRGTAMPCPYNGLYLLSQPFRLKTSVFTFRTRNFDP
ncbi:MAG: hypothetical protein V7K38_09345 [Nostoc sp.]|uniref:hypothetical protein n=1 Tax=Nostoc sp. TaxID=1180 RepID=UPI002FFB2C48